MRTLVIWGAGRIGRGFVAGLFHEPGWRIVFVDIDRALVDGLNAQGGYAVFRARKEGIEKTCIEGGCSALHTGDADVTVGHLVKQGNDDITVLDDEPVVNVVEPYDSHMLILNCPTPVPLGATVNDYKVFWLVVPPVTFTDGFTVYVEDDQGKQFSKSTHNAITIKRSTITKMAPIEVVPE